MLTPDQLAEIEARLADARNGYCTGDNRVYCRHVDWLLQERVRLLEQLADLRRLTTEQ